MFWGGLRFDLSAIVYTSLLLTTLSLLPLPQAYSRGYQRMLTGLYRIVTSLAIILNLGDVVYYRFTLKRTTLAVFEEFGGENPFQFPPLLRGLLGDNALRDRTYHSLLYHRGEVPPS